jgi:hypothetical protein
MSAGAFLTSRYTASYLATAIHPIRVQPETVAAVTVGGTPVANTAPTGAINNPISAIVSRGRRARGLTPRLVRLRLVTGTPPGGYLPGSVTLIPALTEAFFSACNVGTNVTYITGTWVVVGRTPERAA